MSFRTDRNNNPTAFTTDLAIQAKLKLGVDFEFGEAFPNIESFHTARILGDPIDITIRLIDAVGYQTRSGAARWTYINLPKYLWDSMTREQKVTVIGYHYSHEGGIAMEKLFHP